MTTRSLDGRLAYLLLVPIFILSFRPISDMDFWWHMATGKWIAEHGRIPTTEPFTNTAGGTPWIPQQWLTELGMWGLHQLGGIVAIQVVVAGIITAICAILLGSLRRSGVRGALPGAAYLLYLEFLLTPRVQARPDLFNMLFVAVIYAVGTGAGWRLSRRHALGLGALTVLWANLHAGGAVIAPVILGAAAAGDWIAASLRRERSERFGGLALAAAVVFLALAATPAGPSRLLFPYQVWSESTAGVEVSEWKPLFLSEEPGFQPTKWIIPIILQNFLLALAIGRAPARGAAVAVDLLFAGLGLFASRFTYLFFGPGHAVLRTFAADAPAPAAAPASSGAGTARARRVVLAAWCVGLALLVANHDVGVWEPGLTRQMGAQGIGPFDPVFEPNYPVKAARFLSETRLTGRMYNVPYWGGYLEYRLHPHYTTSFDGRIEVFGREVGRDMIAIISNQAREETLAKYGFDILVVDERFFAPARPAAAHWKLVFEDEVSRVYLRDRPENAENFDRARAWHAKRLGK